MATTASSSTIITRSGRRADERPAAEVPWPAGKWASWWCVAAPGSPGVGAASSGRRERGSMVMGDAGALVRGQRADVAVALCQSSSRLDEGSNRGFEAASGDDAVCDGYSRAGMSVQTPIVSRVCRGAWRDRRALDRGRRARVGRRYHRGCR